MLANGEQTVSTPSTFLPLAKATRRLAELEVQGVLAERPVEPVLCEVCGDVGRVLEHPETAGERALGPAPRRYAGYVVTWCRSCPPETQRARQLDGIAAHDIVSCTFARFRTETVEQRNALGLVQRWAQRVDRRPFLFLHGPAGTGKSHLAKAAARYLAEHGYAVQFTTMSGLLEDLKAGFDDPDSVRRRRAERAFLVQVLVLDDLGEERATDWSVAEVRRLLMSRYERRQLTAITSNASLEEIAVRQGDEHGRLVSRLADVALSLVVRLEGEDYRGRAREVD